VKDVREYNASMVKVFAFMEKHHKAKTEAELALMQTDAMQFKTPFEKDMATSVMNEVGRGQTVDAQVYKAAFQKMYYGLFDKYIHARTDEDFKNLSADTGRFKTKLEIELMCAALSEVERFQEWPAN
jgi:hypothetical protein